MRETGVPSRPTLHLGGDSHVVDTTTAAQLAALGVVSASTDANGGSILFDPLIASRPNDSDTRPSTTTTTTTADLGWLAALLASGRRLIGSHVQRIIQSRRQQCSDARSQSLPPAEIAPSCWAAGIPIVQRRRHVGWRLAIVPTTSFLNSELFLALSSAAGLDARALAGRARDALTRSDDEAIRACRLGLLVIGQQLRQAELTRTVESLGQQLAESYEELSLLYTISQRMTVVQQPRRFVQSSCEGLLETLPYRWVGVRFAGGAGETAGGAGSVGGAGVPGSLRGRLIVAGSPGASLETMRSLTGRLLAEASMDGPSVLEPGEKVEDGWCLALGSPVLAHPICREGHVLGVMLAGGKQGDDRAASSSDMKLLGATASHTGIFLENASLYEDMDAMFLGTLEAITSSIDAKDRYTCGHSRRVAQLSQQLASAVGLDEETVRRVHVAGLVHDVGKIGVPESVLCKPGRLTDEEFALVKQHPEIGHRILKDIPQLRDVLPGVLHHHERWDGEGYPSGLAGESIPLFARLIALADSFDAMSSTRTYRSARDRSWVLSEIVRCSGKQFDPSLVSAFIHMDFSEYDRLVAEHRAAEGLSPARLEEAA